MSRPGRHWTQAFAKAFRATVSPALQTNAASYSQLSPVKGLAAAVRGEVVPPADFDRNCPSEAASLDPVCVN